VPGSERKGLGVGALADRRFVSEARHGDARDRVADGHFSERRRRRRRDRGKRERRADHLESAGRQEERGRSEQNADGGHHAAKQDVENCL
jgi:hypothetical protein